MFTDSVICFLRFGAVTAHSRDLQRVDCLDDMVHLCEIAEVCHRI